MKKIINDPSRVVSETLMGMEKAHPELKYTPELEVISRREKTPGKVGVVSGGGSGHEPAHAGYVGKGMLDAAVAGNMFSSPSPDRIIKGIEEANGGKGVLLVIKNYSGDIMNFEMANGMGIHGEPGVERTTVKSAAEVAKILLDKILADYDYAGGEVALLVNGLGGTPLAELYILNNEVQALLDQAGVKVYKTFVGNYMTAIEMAGCSLTLMKLDDELKALLDAPADTPALKVL